jgi:hypothetical protein
MIDRGSPADYAAPNAGLYTWTLTGGSSDLHLDGVGVVCEPTWAVGGDVVQVIFADDGRCSPETVDLRWRLDGDELSFDVVKLEPRSRWSEENWWERSWLRIADALPPSEAPGESAFIGDRFPPDGTYRAELTEDDLVARGASPTYAAQNAGVWTATITGDRWTMAYDRTDATCAGTATIVGDVIRWTDDLNADMGCTGAVDWRWRPEADGIRTQFVPSGTETPADLANYRAFNDRVWIRVGDTSQT